MEFLKISNYVDRCYTNDDGEVIKGLILRELRQGKKVELSFEGVQSVSSSFLNSALIELLDEFSFEVIKSNLLFTNSNKMINEAIRMRFSFELNERKKLINV